MTTVTEAPPSTAVDDVASSSDLMCEECGSAFAYAGRGRRPKKCPSCRKRASKSGSARGQRPSIALLGQSVVLNLQTFGSMVSLVNPVDGQIIMAGAPTFGNACANVAEHDPRFRRMLERSSTMIVYGELIAAALIIVLPILANHGLLKQPDAASNLMGMYQQMGVMYQQQQAGPDGTVSGS